MMGAIQEKTVDETSKWITTPQRGIQPVKVF